MTPPFTGPLSTVKNGPGKKSANRNQQQQQRKNPNAVRLISFLTCANHYTKRQVSATPDFNPGYTDYPQSGRL